MHARLHAATLLAPLLLLTLSGCFVQSKKGNNGENNVDIRTPLGGMSVKTDSADVQNKVGLPVYPGATPEQKHGNDNGSADVNMNFGDFHLRVLARGFDTGDSSDKVRDFYRKALGQYGDVIECRNNMPVGAPVKTALGLTCEEDNHVKAHAHETNGADEVQLKAGSRSRQHIVAFRANGAGTHFGLIALELPSDSDKSA